MRAQKMASARRVAKEKETLIPTPYSLVIQVFEMFCATKVYCIHRAQLSLNIQDARRDFSRHDQTNSWNFTASSPFVEKGMLHSIYQKRVVFDALNGC